MFSFNDPSAATHYIEGVIKKVPGLAALHRMSALLLAEVVPEDGHVLVLGAGGGLELSALAEARPGF
ncbi:tRNA (cmo5U34)-methyltransferase [Lysobacter spongiicola DSM 21749]|uniref:tRNA (Cmo5U34)-methyltransferase n=1 Tax=Lysobacter spongiicola DSM 21749 TaxID=1122188 RepID=A0A1T4ND03_9GAMM|nr:tRNA (cmo5U34)-methyltransferase [Lysobacter spongiicola DSM 21749]